jgi:hypothetical protein
MGLLRQPSDWERTADDRPVDPTVEHKVVRRAAQRIGGGTLACPACDLPLLPVASVAISAPIECPFCSEVRPARHFLRIDAIDTPRNEVHLIARLPG